MFKLFTIIIALLFAIPSISMAFNPLEGNLFKIMKNANKKDGFNIGFAIANSGKKVNEIKMLSQAIISTLDSTVTEEIFENEMKKIEKTEFLYNQDMQAISQLDYIFNYELDEMFLESDTRYSYNANGQMIKVEVYQDQEGEMVFAYQIDITYHTNGYPESVVFSMKDEETGEIIPLENYVNEYNQNGGILKETYNYFVPEMGQWILYMYTDYEYENNRISDSFTYLIDEETMEYPLSSSETYDYDESGNVSYVEYFYYDTEEETFYLLSATQYLYDENGNPTSETSLEMDFATEELNENMQYEYTYDLNVSIDGVIIPDISTFEPEYSNQIVNKPTGYSEWYMVDNWELRALTTYYYSNDPHSVTDYNSIIHIFPNPASETIQVSLPANVTNAQITIYDIAGNKVLNSDVLLSSEINISKFASGIYYYQLDFNNNITKGNFVKY